MPLHALALAVSLALAAPAALAACGGDSLIDRLSPAERARLDAAVAATPHAEGLVWTASRGDSRITLIGTLHLPDPRHAALRDSLAPLIATAGLALFETTPDDAAALEAALAADPSLMFLDDGQTLPALLDTATWEALAAAARDRGMPPFMVSRFRPWFLAMTLALPGCARDAIGADDGGLDRMLMDLAAGAAVPMAALEPWDSLFTLFEQLPFADQVALLKASLMEPALQESLFVAMADGYFAGRIAEIWELNRIAMQDLSGLDPAESERLFAVTEALLLDARNRAWIPVIEAAAARHGRIVVAAGAAHLPGEAGLLRLLADRGWSVSRAPGF
jgi:uncharacterized protein YbaP (TraB family)